MPSRTKPGKSSPLPDFIPPQLATLTDTAPAGDDWIHEIKLDGYRTAARLEAGKVRMLTRSGLDWTARFRPIAAALAVPKIRAAYLDGEIAVLGEDGVTSFAALQDALSRGQAPSADLSRLRSAASRRPRPHRPAPGRAQDLVRAASRRPAQGWPGPLLQPCGGPGAEVLRPGLQAPPRGHRLQTRQRHPTAHVGPRIG